MRSRRYRSLSADGAELHHQVRPAVGGDARLIDGEDRRMRAQLRHQVRLGLEHLANLLVDHLAQHHLDRDLTPWHVLFVEENVGETTGPEYVHVGEPRKHGRLRGQTSSHAVLPPLLEMRRVSIVHCPAGPLLRSRCPIVRTMSLAAQPLASRCRSAAESSAAVSGVSHCAGAGGASVRCPRDPRRPVLSTTSTTMVVTLSLPAAGQCRIDERLRGRERGEAGREVHPDAGRRRPPW